MNIAFIDTVHPILQEMLEARGIRCVGMYNSDRQKLKSEIKDFDGIVIRSRIRMDVDFLTHATKLKFIARSGAGMENIDLDYCKQNNIICFNSPEGNRDAVGEHALGTLLMLLNRLKIADTEVRNGIWLREENRGYEIKDKTIGIIGYGQMGSAFAQKLSGLECKILAYDKYKTGFGNHYVQEVSLQEILNQSDIISIHLPQSEETNYYVNDAFVLSMTKPFYLINTARGKNVNTESLVAGLKNGKILGACLDVLEYEKSSFEKLDIDALPESMKYLMKSEKVILTPHIAGWTHESYFKLSKVLADKIISHFNL